MILQHSFFQKPTLWVAKNLIGKTLVRKYRGKLLKGTITETEAYVGSGDRASHASRGRTARSDVMFGEAGHIYVYLIYGMYYCLNIVTEKKDFPSAVLIRGVKVPGSNAVLNGPGKLTRYFHIDKTLNTKKLGHDSGLWIEEPEQNRKFKISVGPRIGVAYAGKWTRKPWRFFIDPEVLKVLE